MSSSSALTAGSSVGVFRFEYSPSSSSWVQLLITFNSHMENIFQTELDFEVVQKECSGASTRKFTNKDGIAHVFGPSFIDGVFLVFESKRMDNDLKISMNRIFLV